MELNHQNISHSGYINTHPVIKLLFSPETISFISKTVTALLIGLYPMGIIIPFDTIVNVLNSIYDAYRPSTGDIHSRYIIASDENPNYIDEIINQTVQTIVTQVTSNLITDQNNSKLTVWTSLLGDFNSHGLRSHPPIKIRHRKPQTMLFNMRY